MFLGHRREEFRVEVLKIDRIGASNQGFTR